MKTSEENQESREQIDWGRYEKQCAEKAGVSVETVRIVRQLVQDVMQTRQEELLALRYNLPVEKVRQLGGLTAALLERMLRESDKASTEQPQGPGPEVQRETMPMKDYCTQNNGDCQSCSLVNYGRDCMNNPID